MNSILKVVRPGFRLLQFYKKVYANRIEYNSLVQGQNQFESNAKVRIRLVIVSLPQATTRYLSRSRPKAKVYPTQLVLKRYLNPPTPAEKPVVYPHRKYMAIPSHVEGKLRGVLGFH